MKHLNLRMYAMVFALVCVWVIFTLLTGGIFLSTRNLSNLSRQAAVTAILAVGMTLVIVSANIDLSVGYGAGLLGAIAAIIHVWWGQPILVTLIAVICIGILMGLMQGYLVAYQRIPAFIVTLGGFLAYRGLMLAFTKGETIPASRQLAQSDWERLSLVNTRMGAHGRWIGYQWIPLLPTANCTPTIRDRTRIFTHLTIESNRNICPHCGVHLRDE